MSGCFPRYVVLATGYSLVLASASASYAAEQATAAAEYAAPKIDFIRHIQPILSNNCFKCHGPDAEHRESGLRLDLRDAALGPADSGSAAIVPSNVDESELIVRIYSGDEAVRMPPPDSNKKLTDSEKQLLKQWVEQGAEYREHWSYQKLQRPTVPQPRDESAARNEIDRFILSRLDAEGLKLAPEADRVTLIRRVYFDLLGLPPSPQEVDAFVSDQSPDAYEKLVERVLARPQFGERMAMYWLDLVRFGDTGGYHSDNHRDVYLFRDWVIKAFNDNKPFDQFTIEQLAGDLLPNATNGQKIASGYNRLLMTTEEGGAQPKEYAAKYAADRVRNASSVWLGATLGCAECHDHKFDPYTAKDFYSFAAFFADIKEKDVGRQDQTPIFSPEQSAQLAKFDEQIAALRNVLDKQTPELDAAQAEWEKTALAPAYQWTTLTPVEAKSEKGATLKIQEDGTVLASESNPATDVYSIAVKTSLQGITALRVEVLPDDSLPAKGPGRASNGNFVLQEIEATVADVPVTWSSVTASHGQGKYPGADAADGKPNTGWGILPKSGEASHLVLEAAADLGAGSETEIRVKLHQNHGTSHIIGKFRLSATAAARPVRAEGQHGLLKEVIAALAVDAAQRTEEQKRVISAHYRTIAPTLQPLRDELAELQRERDEVVKSAPTTLISISTEPRITRILPRGNWLDETGEVVGPAVPAFLPAINAKDRRPTRLDLARWLVSRENPLVARVLVNRLWKLAFGQGLARSLDDFGAQGAVPSHPELLDWLAVEMIERRWDTKHMLRQIVLSKTYRQSSSADKSLRDRDPSNTLLARQNRFRIDAEFVRDNALEISGLLSKKIGGPSVKPYQPAGYWSFLNFPVREYQHDHGEDQYRRGLYTYVQRTFPHPSLVAFDAPSREECTVERPRSNTPLQALVLLNDPTYVEAARVLAERVLREGGKSPEERLQYAYRRALSRSPRTDEVNLLLPLLAKHAEQYAADAAAAKSAVSAGEWPVPTDLDQVELAAWTSVARVILNLHETITRY